MVKVIDQPFDKAKDFLGALRLSNAEWWTFDTVTEEKDRDWQRDWIFRGESSTRFSEDWKPLLPSVWRKKNRTENSTFSVVQEQIANSRNFQMEIQSQLSGRSWIRLDREVSEDERQKTLRLIQTAILNAFTEITLVNEFIDLADELGFRVSRLPSWTRSAVGVVTNYVKLFFPPLKLGPPTEAEPNITDILNDVWSNISVALAQHHGIPTRLLDWTRNP